MIFTSPGQIALKIFNVSIHWYGIIIAIAFVVGLLTAIKIAENDPKKDQNVSDTVIDLANYLLISAIIGARLYYVAFNFDIYSHNLPEIFKLWNGGLSIHGALIGGAITLVLYTYIKKLKFLKYADYIAYGLIVGQAIGRWGNFFNSEAFGMPTDLPWKLHIAPVFRPEKYIDFSYFHPTFLYESIWNILVFCLLYFVLSKKFLNYRGAIFFSYLVLYSVGRFFIEQLRVDSIFYLYGLPLAQLVSVLMFFIGILGLVFVFKFKKS